jgi:hypothetical protein
MVMTRGEWENGGGELRRRPAWCGVTATPAVAQQRGEERGLTGEG